VANIDSATDAQLGQLLAAASYHAGSVGRELLELTKMIHELHGPQVRNKGKTVYCGTCRGAGKGLRLASWPCKEFARYCEITGFRVKADTWTEIGVHIPEHIRAVPPVAAELEAGTGVPRG